MIENIRRLIGLATPCGQAKRKRCYDRGGVVPGQLRQLAEMVLEVDVSIDRHEFLDVLEGMKAEYSHYCAFADVHDALRPAGTPKLDPRQLEPWPEEDALTALRYKHQAEHGALGMRACKLTEGGYCTLFSEGMALRGKPGADGSIAEACAKVYDDEFEHMLAGIAGIAEENLSEADWRLLETLVTEQLRQRIRMRNAQFSYPLSEERVQAIYRGEIKPLDFDYLKASGSCRRRRPGESAGDRPAG